MEGLLQLRLLLRELLLALRGQLRFQVLDLLIVRVLLLLLEVGQRLPIGLLVRVDLVVPLLRQRLDLLRDGLLLLPVCRPAPPSA